MSLTKQISIIPLFNIFCLVFQLIIFQHVCDFTFRKAKILCKAVTDYGNHIQIIQTGKYTFLADSKTSGNYSKFQTFIRLQCRFHKGTYKYSHLIIEACKVCIFQRYIVFIYQYDYFLMMVSLQTFR